MCKHNAKSVQLPGGLQPFLDDWQKDANAIKPLFLSLCDCLKHMEGVALEYKGRPGVSHSLRALYPGRAERPLFVLVDIIDDDPDARWLSLCFYADLTTDPEGLGDVVPGGLSGEDARCFDIDSHAPETEAFLLERLCEAFTAQCR